MNLSQQLAPNVPPLLRDYIDAKIAEEIAPLRERLRLETANYESLRASVMKMAADMSNEVRSLVQAQERLARK